MELEMKNTITHISINWYTACDGFGDITIFRGHKNLHRYDFRTLTRYQRAVRLLNAFVERTMK